MPPVELDTDTTRRHRRRVTGDPADPDLAPRSRSRSITPTPSHHDTRVLPPVLYEDPIYPYTTTLLPDVPIVGHYADGPYVWRWSEQSITTRRIICIGIAIICAQLVRQFKEWLRA